jgi:hypothetical protein
MFWCGAQKIMKSQFGQFENAMFRPTDNISLSCERRCVGRWNIRLKLLWLLVACISPGPLQKKKKNG